MTQRHNFSPVVILSRILLAIIIAVPLSWSKNMVMLMLVHYSAACWKQKPLARSCSCPQLLCLGPRVLWHARKGFAESCAVVARALLLKEADLV